MHLLAIVLIFTTVGVRILQFGPVLRFEARGAVTRPGARDPGPPSAARGRRAMDDRSGASDRKLASIRLA